MKTIKVKKLEVPVGAMPDVVDLLIKNELDNSLAAGSNADASPLAKVCIWTAVPFDEFQHPLTRCNVLDFALKLASFT